MSLTGRYLFRMTLFLAAVGGVGFLLLPGLRQAFYHNVGLNALIVAVFALGVFIVFRQMALLGREARWVENCRLGRTENSGFQPRLLASLATMLGERRERFALSPISLRSVLDGVAARLDETREISTYFAGLMIFLGLLGTFWGLSMTVGSIGDVIGSLSIANNDMETAFASLKQGLDQPLSGMGTAFSSSLLGLSGSLVLGFLGLQMGQAQNAFYNALEEWLSGQVRIGSGFGGGDGGEAPVPVYIQALLEQTAESVENLSRVMERGEEGRSQANASMRQLNDRLESFVDQMRTEQALMLKLAESQLEMRPILARLAEERGASALDEIGRSHLRSIDATLSRLADETAAGREDAIRQIRSEFKLLARTIGALAEVGGASRPPERRDF